ncbi:MAG: hypothetical protein KatS3mg114_0251 [Planctomycetaceae bacterium]|nr:MAG: hypothetical protein KatS3mg114_0251 [Planctomycetaceae bacterium]
MSQTRRRRITERSARSSASGEVPRGWWSKLWRWRWFVLLPAGLWSVLDGYPRLVEQQARRHLSRHDVSAAAWWLEGWGRWLPSSPARALLQARLARKRGDMEATRRWLEQAQQLGADPRLVQREALLAMAQSGQLREAEPHLPRLLVEAGDEAPEVSEAFVLGYMRTLRTADALRLLEAWIADWPEQPRPWLLRARLYVMQHQYTKARADFLQALQRDPQFLPAALELAELLWQQNEPQQAVPYFTRCLHDRHEGVRALVGLALCYKALGESERVTAMLDQALRQDPQHVLALRERARWALEQGDAAAAIPWLQQAFQHSRDDELHYLMAQALQAMGQASEAEKHLDIVRQARETFRRITQLEDALHDDPSRTDLLAELGELLLTLEPEEGVLRLLAALDRDPCLSVARQLLIDHYQQRAQQEPEFAKLADWHRSQLQRPDCPSDSATPNLPPQSGE